MTTLRTGRKPDLRALALASTALVACGLGQAWAADAAAAPGGIETVVVTAEKRPDTVLNVPSAIAVVSADQLKERDFSSLVDLTSTVPGLSVASRGATGFNQIILRGITSGSQQTSPTVGIVVDDVPFGTSSPSGSSSLQPDLDPADISRIEILKGPQGTLYGASTLGGLIKYVTNAPDPNAFSASLSAGFKDVDDGAGGGDVRGAVNIPLIDDVLAVRASGFYRDDPGYIDDPVDHRSNVNTDHSAGGRISLGFYPASNVEIRVNAFFQDTTAEATGEVDLDPNTLQPIHGDLTNGRVAPDFFHNKYQLFSGTAKWDLGGVSLVSATGYGMIRSAFSFDVTPAYGFITALYSGGALPAADVLAPQDFRSNKFSQELRLESDGSGRFNWRIGGFYTSETLDIATGVDAYNPATFVLMPSVFGPLSTAFSHATYEEKAVFGDVRYSILDDVELSGGLRWAQNDQYSVTTATGLLIDPAHPTTPETYPPPGPARNSSESVLTYSVSGKWTYGENKMVYARVASGYRPGGPTNLTPSALAASVPSSYDSDTVTNYEVGTKGLWLDNTLSIDADLFYVDWKDIQLPTLIAGFNVESNGGGAVSRGAELNIGYTPDEHWRFGARGSYTDAHLTTDALVAGYAKGDRLPAVPVWDLAGDIDYGWTISDSLGADLGISLKYSSDRDVGQSQNALNPLRTLPDYTTADLRAGLVWDKYSLNAYIRNVSDTRAYYSGGALRAVAGQNVPFEAIPIQPRTFGLTLSASY
ncbi:MAG: TonB-dependent receptor [Rhizomicrobium sp.]